MEIRQLRSFRTVARLLSFKKAAERLNYAQSSISAQIQALEDDLGVRLFDRLGRNKILLTDAGQSLLHYADKIIALEEETRSEINGAKEPRGTLTIRVPESMCVHVFPAVIRTFRAQYPRVQLNLTTCAHEGLQNDLRKGITDLAFLLTESVQAADLEVEVLGFEPVIMVASPVHHLAKKKKVKTDDLAKETILLSRVDCSYRKSFENILDETGIRNDTPLIFHSVAALKQCVAEGVGISILPEVAARKDLSAGTLIRLNWEEGAIEVGVLMIWYKEKWLSPTLKAFMDATRKELRKIYR